MCGIFGCIGGHHERPVIDEAVDRLRHRGPDDRGVERFGGDAVASGDAEARGAGVASGDSAGRGGGDEVWLGFRRLSILDLSPAGHQPMAEDTGRFWIVFNGEVYNFRELRRELAGRGHRFRSGTDTEVILHAYREWGPDALQRFVGMFALAIWDTRRRELFLARDRLGIKPLYYVQTGRLLAFASEIKALLALPEVERRLDPGALARFLNFLWVPDPDTMFEGVKQLEAGTCATFRDGALTIRRYWDVPLAPPTPISESEAVDRLDELLHESVELRLVSDVPLGAFLSGGVDSSLVVALMRRGGARRILTETVGAPAGDGAWAIDVDDVPWARVVRDHFGDLDYREKEMTPDVVALLPRLVWHLDDPVADSAAIPTYMICRSARERATVMLSGMGAEELFCGYRRHRATLVAERWLALPRLLREDLIRPLVECLPAARPGRFTRVARAAKKFVRSASEPFEDRYLGYLSYYRADELPVAAAGAGATVLERHRSVLARAAGLDPLRRMSYLDLKTFLPNLNLAYTDRASMAASVEVRVPLLDHRIVEFVATLPDDLLVRGRRQKHVLKEVAGRYLPAAVVDRPKSGFSAPVRAWVARDLRPMIGDLLSPDRLRRRGVLEPDAVWATVRDQWSGREDNALRIWALLTFELWAQTFLDGDGAAPVPA